MVVPPVPLPPSSPTAGKLKLLVCGDVHDDWLPHVDNAILRTLRPDATIFLGDFGNGRDDLVHQIASLKDVPKAVVLGNHDAWHCLTRSAAKRHLSSKQSFDRRSNEEFVYGSVESQLGALGSSHVGYASKAFVTSGGQPFTVVGGRPFSKGGPDWSQTADFYERFYKVGSMAESASRVYNLLRSAPHNAPVILAAHNGPLGLGDRRHDICGVDFFPQEGDHGDPDHQQALQLLDEERMALWKEKPQSPPRLPTVPLCLFGHMHMGLQGPQHDCRNMAHIDPETGRVYLNCANVPRIVPHNLLGLRPSHPQASKCHCFTVVTLVGGHVTNASAWYFEDATGKAVISSPMVETVSFTKDILVRRAYLAHERKWGQPIAMRINPLDA